MSGAVASERGTRLERLRELMREGGGLLAACSPSGPTASAAGDRPAAGPARRRRARARQGRREEYELLVEAIYEGYLLHYGDAPRACARRKPTSALLAGDRLYAIGLARLVALGDTDAVAELADTITLSALAHGAGEPELADAVWAGGRARGRLGLRARTTAGPRRWSSTATPRRSRRCAQAPRGLPAPP